MESEQYEKNGSKRNSLKEEVASFFKGSISSSEDEFKSEETFSEFSGVDYCQLEEEQVFQVKKYSWGANGALQTRTTC